MVTVGAGVVVEVDADAIVTATCAEGMPMMVPLVFTAATT
jgi:hypothetical protein